MDIPMFYQKYNLHVYTLSLVHCTSGLITYKHICDRLVAFPEDNM